MRVGVVLAKKTDESGNTILLVADSNSNRDGMIKVSVVTQYNIDQFFGVDNDNRYIISTIKDI